MNNFKRMLKPIYLFISMLIILGCASSQKSVNDEKCLKFYEFSYPKITQEREGSSSRNDSIIINEMRFECLSSALFTHKVMYDKFGKWNKEIYTSRTNNPILVWENVDLYSSGKKYHIFTHGIETNLSMYGSVMVFDEHYNDLLSTNSSEKQSLTQYFTDMVKNLKMGNEDFFEVYWKMIDPKIWETINRSN